MRILSFTYLQGIHNIEPVGASIALGPSEGQIQACRFELDFPCVKLGMERSRVSGYEQRTDADVSE